MKCKKQIYTNAKEQKQQKVSLEGGGYNMADEKLEITVRTELTQRKTTQHE